MLGTCCCCPPAGLSLQLLLAPNTVRLDPTDTDDGVPVSRNTGPQLPKLSMTAKPEELAAAFAQAERQGKREAEKAAANRDRSNNSGSSSGSGGKDSSQNLI